MTKETTLAELFTDAELSRAERLYAHCKGGEFNRRCVAEIVTPTVLTRINKKLGQENEARYLAYLIEHALMQARRP